MTQLKQVKPLREAMPEIKYIDKSLGQSVIEAVLDHRLFTEKSKLIKQIHNTTLPKASEVVGIDVEKLAKVIFDMESSRLNMDWESLGNHSVVRRLYMDKANAITQSDCLSWRTEK